MEAIFNHKNFWINLDREKPVKDINFDFEDNLEWEYVMLSDAENLEDDDQDADPDSGDEEEEEKDVLDMPPSWSPKLFIDKEKFLNLCPNGEKTVFYKKCRIDFYTPCKQVDGLIKRVTLFEDYKCLIVSEIRHYYENRRDKLKIRIRYPYEFKTVCHYAPCDEYSYWKKLIYIEGQERTIYFYHHRNNKTDKDGLIFRQEIIGKKTIEKYKDREDKLVFRSVEFYKKPQVSKDQIPHENTA